MDSEPTSWGRWPRHAHERIALTDRFQLPAFDPARRYLPWGQGRSYGDSCQNDQGVLLETRRLDRLIAFDRDSGVIECEAGMLMRDLIAFALPQGWFVPVTPGTSHITLGGAIANDVHGKNHHREGCFGRHVLGFELLRSDGSTRWCSLKESADWFGASVGGLGLTGLIRRLRLQLRRVPGAFLQGDSLRFGALSEFFALSKESDTTHEYTVAWLDCAARGANQGRGVFIRANHSDRSARTPAEAGLQMPFTPPISLVNRASLSAFNALYFHRPAATQQHAVWHYRPFFYPLDSVGQWNRLYGPQGFYQYQCVIPEAAAEPALREMLAQIAASGSGSFLAVLKMFGDLPSQGWLSFPRAGATLALDFPNRGEATLALLERLDNITRAAQGAVYPAKDARMSAAAFQQYFPRWQQMDPYLDPQFSSSFWRRVTA